MFLCTAGFWLTGIWPGWGQDDTWLPLKRGNFSHTCCCQHCSPSPRKQAGTVNPCCSQRFPGMLGVPLSKTTNWDFCILSPLLLPSCCVTLGWVISPLAFGHFEFVTHSGDFFSAFFCCFDTGFLVVIVFLCFFLNHYFSYNTLKKNLNHWDFMALWMSSLLLLTMWRRENNKLFNACHGHLQKASLVS